MNSAAGARTILRFVPDLLPRMDANEANPAAALDPKE